jgi:glycosyltransferase involved in cell wall biosynthesis
VRILTLTNLYPNPLQPQRATYNRLQLREVARRHDVAVISPVAWTDELAHRWHGRRLPAGRRAVLDGIPVEYPRYLFVPRVLRGMQGRFYHWSIRRAFCRAVAEFRPDLVFAAWAYPDGWAAVRLGREAGLPVVLKVVGSDVLLLPKHPGRLCGTLEALRGADSVVAVSQDLERRMIGYRIDPARVRVVYDGVDPAAFHPDPRHEARARLGLDADVPLLLFVGNLLPVKGLDYLLKACGRLASEGVNFRCVLIGQGTLCATLKREAARLGLGDRVHFAGTVANELLPDWYRAATVFALPSRSEGVPNVLLEAAACGTPFVASRVGGVPEIAHLGPSELVPSGDVPALAAALKGFLTGATPTAAVPRPPTRTRADSAAELIEVFEQACQARAVRAAATIAGCPPRAHSDRPGEQRDPDDRMARDRPGSQTDGNRAADRRWRG